MRPDTKFAKAGELNIAYQEVGSGPDLVFVLPRVSNVDILWEHRLSADFMQRLSRFSHFVQFDSRGSGLSDHVSGIPPLEERIEDILAVLDATSIDRATFLGTSDSGPLCILFASMYPDRTERLILFETYASSTKHEDYPWGQTSEERAKQTEFLAEMWTSADDMRLLAPEMVGDPSFTDFWSRLKRAAIKPGDLREFFEYSAAIDVRAILPTIQAPTLVIHRKDSLVHPAGAMRYLAERIPGASYVEVSGSSVAPFVNSDEILRAIEFFITGRTAAPITNRVLMTLLFTDIVGSTDRLRQVGDRAWRDILDTYYASVRDLVGSFEGRVVDTAGDGLLATFGGPARAINCGLVVNDAAKKLGLEVRSGVHAGEVETTDDGVVGVAVHTAARVSDRAKAGQILVTEVVNHLLAGSGISCSVVGDFELKGLMEPMRLFEVRH